MSSGETEGPGLGLGRRKQGLKNRTSRSPGVTAWTGDRTLAVCDLRITYYGEIEGRVFRSSWFWSPAGWARGSCPSRPPHCLSPPAIWAPTPQAVPQRTAQSRGAHLLNDFPLKAIRPQTVVQLQEESVFGGGPALTSVTSLCLGGSCLQSPVLI